MTAMLIGAGCAPAPISDSRTAMPTPTPRLVGSWEQTTPSECSQLYPDTIEFQENGIYTGHKEPPGTFTLWDAGEYEITGLGKVSISLANDAVVTYEFTIEDDVLSFVDADGCEFSYQRLS